MKYYVISEIADDKVRILGRNDGCKDPVTLYWHGSGIELCVKASNLWVQTYSDYDFFEEWIGVWIDGAFIFRQMVPKGESWLPVYLTGDPSVTHHVKIIKEVQPIGDDIHRTLQIGAIRTDGELLPVPEPKARLEFIGDSITSGEGTIGAKNEMAWNPMVMSASYAYPFMISEMLGTESRMVSQGGWGVYVSYDADTTHNIPDQYDRICSVFKEGNSSYEKGIKPYDFSSWKADAVIINLGTNDESGMNKEPDKISVADIVDAEIRFLKKVRDKNPDAYIYWVGGSFPGMQLPEHLEEGLGRYVSETGDQKARMVKVPPFTDETVGSRAHPGPIWHRQTAETLASIIRTDILK